MAYKATIQKIEVFPRESLLPDEVAIKIGCDECSLAVAGCYLARGDRTQRTTLRETIGEALELTDIPGKVKNGGQAIDYNGDCNSVCPGNDSQAKVIIEEALTI